MSKDPLAIAKAKVNRAGTQIGEFDHAVRDFFRSNDYRVVSDLNFDATERIWRFELVNSDTSALSVMAGEIIHNLRSALDNVACEIAHKHSGRRDQSYFPFGKRVDIFQSEAARKCKFMPPEAVEAIASFQPYAGGDDLLWAIHDLNREDKHPGLTIVGPQQGAIMRGLKVSMGRALIIGNRNGQHLLAGGYVPKRVPFAMEKQGEFLTTTPGAHVEYDGRPGFQIALRPIRGFERKGATHVLGCMRDRVEHILTTLAKRFL